MPTETGTAFLVDPMGHAPEAITQREYESIRQYLDLPDGAACGAIEWLLRTAAGRPGMDDAEELEQSLFHYANNRPTETIGALARVFHSKDARFKDIEDLSEEETGALQHALAALRAGGWFSEWLKIQLCSVACNPTDPKYHHPTPLQIASTLTEFIKEHEDRLDAARELAEMRPDLLFPAPAEPQATPEPPAVEEIAQPTRKGTTGHPRARKPRKKASRG